MSDEDFGVRDELKELDQRVVAAARGIKVLSDLAWPFEARETFLNSWQAGNPRLPEVTYRRTDFSAAASELSAVMSRCDRAHGLEDFVYRTARSYSQAIRLLGSLGTPDLLTHSRTLYGDPSQSVAGDATTTLSAAAHLMNETAPFVGDCGADDEDYCILPRFVAEEMTRAAARFDRDPVKIVVDASLSAKAAAGAHGVRLRGRTSFSEADIPQLVQHELLIHTLTALNGRLQPTLSCLGLGAPRTTETQEGLAVFAELITNSMDINRLRRIAARVVAIDMALSGADFIEVFKYFLEVGQTEGESFASAQRVFRGTDARGGTAFTKDGVYFQGLVRVHRFLRDAVREGRVDDPTNLMLGRLHARDVERLTPWIHSGVIVPPRYLPDWVRTRSRMIAFLLYSSFAVDLHLDSLMAPAETAPNTDE